LSLFLSITAFSFVSSFRLYLFLPLAIQSAFTPFFLVLLPNYSNLRNRIVLPTPATAMAAPPPPARQWGVTPPISTTLPTAEELAANDDLIAELKLQNNFESPAETERR
jgi:hypothetical protein